MTMARYEQASFLAKKPFFNFLGRKFWIYGADGSTQFYVERKAFKLKEAIKVFSDESKSEHLMSIGARSILDFSGTYDVTDETTGDQVGSLKRKGLKSILRDEWAILDTNENEIGIIQEDSAFLSMVRRLAVGKLLPQSYSIKINDEEVGRIKQQFNPFVLKFDVTFTDNDGKLDRRLGIAAVIMMLIIEGRQG